MEPPDLTPLPEPMTIEVSASRDEGDWRTEQPPYPPPDPWEPYWNEVFAEWWRCRRPECEGEIRRTDHYCPCCGTRVLWKDVT